MQKINRVFHFLSYLQYPNLIVVMYFMIKPYLHGYNHAKDNLDMLFQNLNSMLIFIGIGLAFAALQDPRKTSFKFEKKLYENSKIGNILIFIILILIILSFAYGIILFFIQDKENLNEISSLLSETAVGCMVMGIGLLGYLKFAIEVVNNHRQKK